MHPLAGTWIANIAKSTRHENHQFASSTMRFDISPGEVKFTYEGVNASGKLEKGEQTLNVDGQPHDHPQAPGIAVTSSLGPRGIESSATKEGVVLGRGTYDVSEDGQTMTATVNGIDGAGKAFEQVIVFDRGA
jgi:hypothetical protein